MNKKKNQVQGQQRRVKEQKNNKRRLKEQKKNNKNSWGTNNKTINTTQHNTTQHNNNKYNNKQNKQQDLTWGTVKEQTEQTEQLRKS